MMAYSSRVTWRSAGRDSHSINCSITRGNSLVGDRAGKDALQVCLYEVCGLQVHDRQQQGPEARPDYTPTASVTGHTYGGVVCHVDDLHGHLLSLALVAPLAHSGADDVERLKQGTGGSVSAAKLSQLPRLGHQCILRQQLGRTRQGGSRQPGFSGRTLQPSNEPVITGPPVPPDSSVAGLTLILFSTCFLPRPHPFVSKTYGDGVQDPHCSPPVEEGPRKGGPNIVCSAFLRVASRSHRVIPLAAETTRRERNSNLLQLLHGTSLLDTVTNKWPRRRTALVAAELARYNIDIAALSETRFADEGSLEEVGEGYTFFWRGLPNDARRIHGVGFAIKTTLLRHLPEVPAAIVERLMTLRLPLAKSRFATLVSVYAPTLNSEEGVKDRFYDNLCATLQSIPRNDKIILLGDFNARVGTNHEVWQGVIGRHGVGNMNSSGLRLLSLCSELGLTITNTFFQLRNMHKTSWMHPRSKHWQIIDYVIVRRRDLHDAAFLSHTPDGLQRSLDVISETYHRAGLIVNTKKMEVLPSVPPAGAPILTISGTQLKNIGSFTYLGTNLIYSCDLTDEVQRRLNLASSAFGRLSDQVFTNRNLKIHTKVAVYNAVVISTLLYGCETWVPYRRHVKLLESFHTRRLQQILGIRCSTGWGMSSGCPQIGCLDKSSTDSSQGPRSAGGQKKRYKDHVKATLKRSNIPFSNLETPAAGRDTWRSTCADAMSYFDAEYVVLETPAPSVSYLRQAMWLTHWAPQPSEEPQPMRTKKTSSSDRTDII
ncbi:Craniofacial development protein 2 [Merluccius polli]|uniref:Craniofacial development protein 2 n=1 Tax=Merluccius polli TaxID=89951 RepID=A0AA47M0K4_MERPO|nr:Craniofacial development protein 2 [Merluccius polli]